MTNEGIPCIMDYKSAYLNGKDEGMNCTNKIVCPK